MEIGYKTILDRLNKILDERPEPPEEQRAEENYLRLQLRNAIEFIKKQEAERSLTATRLKNAGKIIKNFERLIANFGFRKVGIGYGGSFTYKNLPYCWCGHQPQVQECITEPGYWLVKCPECDIRTAQHKKIKDAIKDWCEKKWTEDSIAMNKRYSIETLDDDGTLDIAEKALAIAAEDYLAGTDRTKAEIERFVEHSDLLAGLNRQAAIEGLRKLAAERQKEGA